MLSEVGWSVGFGKGVLTWVEFRVVRGSSGVEPREGCVGCSVCALGHYRVGKQQDVIIWIHVIVNIDDDTEKIILREFLSMMVVVLVHISSYCMKEVSNHNCPHTYSVNVRVPSLE